MVPAGTFAGVEIFFKPKLGADGIAGSEPLPLSTERSEVGVSHTQNKGEWDQKRAYRKTPLVAYLYATPLCVGFLCSFLSP